MQEVTLNTIPGVTADERVAVVLCQHSTGESKIEIHQQSWGEGAGWFTQSKVVLLPTQVPHLASMLGKSSPSRKVRVPAATGWTPRVVSADSA